MRNSKREADLQAGLAAVAQAQKRAAEGDAAAARDLLAALGDRAALVREAAARAIHLVAHDLQGTWPAGAGGDVAAVGTLLAAVAAAEAAPPASDPACRIRKEAVMALGELRGPVARVEPALRHCAGTVQIEIIMGAPEDTAVMLRANAALVMAQLQCDCLPDLGLLLFDGVPDPVTHVDWTAGAREAAARAIALLGDPAGAALLAVRLRERREAGEVLAACIDALCALEHPRAAAWIAPMLQAQDPQACVAAATALCALRPDEAAEAIPARAAIAPPGLAEALVIALGSARSALTVPAVRRLLEDGRPVVRRAAAAALEALGVGTQTEGTGHGGRSR